MSTGAAHGPPSIRFRALKGGAPAREADAFERVDDAEARRARFFRCDEMSRVQSAVADARRPCEIDRAASCVMNGNIVAGDAGA